jgi:hypothetical protein
MIKIVADACDVFRCRLVAQDRGQAGSCGRGAIARRKGRFAHNASRPALLPRLTANHHGGRANREGCQQLPKIVAIAQLGKLASSGAFTEALRGTDRHVFFVERPTAVAGELRSGEPDKSLEITVP